MKKRSSALLITAALATAGCYHAIIDTGLATSGQSVQQPWAMSFVAGLVPPPVMETAQKCPDGVARVETQHSFMNSVVAIITAGIVTPMTIEVQCASPRRAQLDPTSVIRANGMSTVRAVELAIERSAASGEPAFVRFK